MKISSSERKSEIKDMDLYSCIFMHKIIDMYKGWYIFECICRPRHITGKACMTHGRHNACIHNALRNEVDGLLHERFNIWKDGDWQERLD